MQLMKQFKSTDLLACLIALLELQIYAVQAKRKCPASAARKYLNMDGDIRRGLCWNVYCTPSSLPELHAQESILKHVIRNAPSNTSASTGFPVNSNIPYEPSSTAYSCAEPFAMWGDHAYADNRRLLISEMIWQLRIELQSRGYKL